jgi:hypothetical protein
MLDMITVRLLDHVLLRQHVVWGPGLALVGMSIVEQRYQAVLAVLAGDPVVDVAAKVGVSRQSVHTWLRRYADDGLAGLHLASLLRQGGRPAGPPPLPPAEPGQAVEVDRTVNRAGTVSLGQHLVLAAEILGGRRVGIRIEQATLMFFDLDTRQLRTRPNPITPADISRLRGVRPAGPPPHATTGPVQVQRRASNSGVVMIVGQKVALGRINAGKTLTIEVTDTDLTIHTDTGPQTVRRTNQQPVRNLKASRPRRS